MKKYITNPNMEFIPLDETEQVIHDNESGDIHYLDEISGIILSQLAESITLDTLLERLLEMFDGEPEEIRADTVEFLEEMAAKNVVLVTDDAQ